MVKIRFEGKCLANCDFFTKSDPYLILSRPITKGAYDFKQVRKTETIKNNLNPSWKLIYISMSELCDKDLSLPIRITVFDYDHNSHDDLIGQTETTLRDLMNHSASGAPLSLKIGEKKRGELLVRQCETEDTSSDILTRKMSMTNYPQRKGSNASVRGFSPPSQVDGPSLNYNQPQQMYPSHMEPTPQYQHMYPSHMQPTPQYQQPQFEPIQEVHRPHLGNQQPAMSNYQQPHINYQQPPMTSTFQNHPPPPYQQPSTFQAFPDDPTDQRPQSIWINHQ